MLIALGLPFRQDHISTRSATPPDEAGGRPVSIRAVMGIELGTVVLAAISPAIAAGLTMATRSQASGPASIAMGEGCIVRTAGSTEPVVSRVTTELVDV